MPVRFFLRSACALLAAVCPTLVEAADSMVGVTMELARPAVSFSVDDDYALIYKDNSEVSPGLEVRYGDFGARLSTSALGSDRLNARRPATRYFDARAYHRARVWAVEAESRYFRGFHARSEQSGQWQFDHGALQWHRVGVDVYRALGRDSEVFRTTQGRVRTGFEPNFFAVTGVSRQALDGSRPLLDTLSTADGSAFEDMHRLTALSAYAGGGVTLNLNLAGFHIDPTAMAGLGVQHRTSDADVSAWGTFTKIHLKVLAGYAFDGFTVGVEVMNDAIPVELGRDLMLFHSVTSRFRVDVFF